MAAIAQLAVNKQTMQQQFASATSIHLLLDLTSQLSPHSFLTASHMVKAVAKEVVQAPVLHSQANATHVHHLQTIWSIKALKVACLPLMVGEVVDMPELYHCAADPHLHHFCPTICAMLDQCTPTSSRTLPIGMYVFLVVLMWRMDIHPKHALQHGGMSTTRRGSIVPTQINTSLRGMMRSQRQNFKSQFPASWQCGAEQVDDKCVKLFTGYTPTLYPNLNTVINEDNITLVTLNKLMNQEVCAHSMHQ
jgi:hypothetical protein